MNLCSVKFILLYDYMNALFICPYVYESMAFSFCHLFYMRMVDYFFYLSVHACMNLCPFHFVI